ncbi:MAG: hypothetical protein IZT59_08090 [Verrucomicrobia bacterium]|mgnify:CR=1 FL=1|jgi:hypothetical protein|nr:hypothetical protein [Verrucomicrobiota bacterium]|tara:strand:+ start:28217 stop:28627 length:411 start_codon:yes stop_codon:yes gene_type:complete
MSTLIKLQREEELPRFLQTHGFHVEDLGSNVFQVIRGEEIPVFLKLDDKQIYFEVDLGPAAQVANLEFYTKLLDMNTEVLPVSFGLDTSNPEDTRLVLVESRETGDLCDQELLAVFDALELAVDRVTPLINEAINA